MNKKFFAGLLIVSIIVFAGGCGGKSHSVSSTTDANATLNGVWTSSSNGTATLTVVNSDDVNDLIEVFEELPSEVLEYLKIYSPDIYELYNESMNHGTVETANAAVTRVMAIFESCDISKDKGTAKLTAIVIVSNDTSYLPIFLNRVMLETTSKSTNEWTAKASSGETFSIKMISEEEMNLSGKLPNYECDFSTVIKKNPSNSIQPTSILDGTWQSDGTQSGGYFAKDSSIGAALIPEKVSIAFKNTKEENSTLKSSVTSFYSVFMNEKNEDMPVFQNISPTSGGTLTQIQDNLYKFTSENGDESLIVIENTDEIFVFQTESVENWQTCMFLPLKKVSFDLGEALKKTWSASEGGGYIKFNDDVFDTIDNELLRSIIKAINTISLTLKNSTLKFSDATWNDNGSITATMNIATSFSYTNDILEAINFPSSYLDHNENGKVTITPSANFLQFEYDGGVYRISFLSDTEAFFSLEVGIEGLGEAMYYVKFSAN